MFKTINKEKKPNKNKEKERKKEQRRGYLITLKLFIFFTYIHLFCCKMIQMLQRKYIYPLSYTKHHSSAVCEK